MEIPGFALVVDCIGYKDVILVAYAHGDHGDQDTEERCLEILKKHRCYSENKRYLPCTITVDTGTTSPCENFDEWNW
jgi:hypothetical protein